MERIVIESEEHKNGKKYFKFKTQRVSAKE